MKKQAHSLVLVWGSLTAVPFQHSNATTINAPIVFNVNLMQHPIDSDKRTKVYDNTSANQSWSFERTGDEGYAFGHILYNGYASPGGVSMVADAEIATVAKDQFVSGGFEWYYTNVFTPQRNGVSVPVSATWEFWNGIDYSHQPISYTSWSHNFSLGDMQGVTTYQSLRQPLAFSSSQSGFSSQRNIPDNAGNNFVYNYAKDVSAGIMSRPHSCPRFEH